MSRKGHLEPEEWLVEEARLCFGHRLPIVFSKVTFSPLSRPLGSWGLARSGVSTSLVLIEVKQRELCFYLPSLYLFAVEEEYIYVFEELRHKVK